MKTLLRLGLILAGLVFTSAAVGQSSIRILNQSVRGLTSRNGHKLILGFALNAENHRILIRAIGPALSQFGVTNPIADPRFYLMDSKGSIIDENDSWDPALAKTFADAGAFALRSSKEAALLKVLPKGTYTALIENVDDVEAIGLIEIYDLDASSDGLVNVSIRGHTAPGEAMIIPGITIAGSGSSSILIREIGPSLKLFGITDYLLDPLLTVQQKEPAATLGSATDWKNWSTFVFARVGAFPPLPDSNDAAFGCALSFTGSPSGKEVKITLTATAGSVSSSYGEVLVETYMGWRL